LWFSVRRWSFPSLDKKFHNGRAKGVAGMKKLFILSATIMFVFVAVASLVNWQQQAEATVLINETSLNPTLPQPPPPGQYTLEVVVEPPDAGSVLVEPAKPFYRQGEVVKLTAKPSTDLPFSHWEEDTGFHLGSDSLRYTMTRNLKITAHFRQYTLEVAVEPPDAGTVLVEPIKPFYSYGEIVRLSAKASTDLPFSHWEQDTGWQFGSNQLRYAVKGNHKMTAHFRMQPLWSPPPPPPPVYLWLTIPFTIVLGAAILTLVFIRQPMSTNSRLRLTKGMRWSARVIGVGGTLFYIFFVFAASTFGDPLTSSGPGAIFTGATVVIALAGCFMSWWRESLAGVLFVTCWLASFGLVITVVVMGSRYDVPQWSVAGIPFLIAGVLFFLSWWFERKTILSTT
jgi:hypothetical protein